MIEPVKKLLSAIDTINKIDDEIDDYRTKFKPNYSYMDLLMMEMKKTIFDESDRNELLNAIEVLEKLNEVVR